jgi:exonuclease VII small subunit
MDIDKLKKEREEHKARIQEINELISKLETANKDLDKSSLHYKELT